jgi:hypothetical protein
VSSGFFLFRGRGIDPVREYKQGLESSVHLIHVGCVREHVTCDVRLVCVWEMQLPDEHLSLHVPSTSSQR